MQMGYSEVGPSVPISGPTLVLYSISGQATPWDDVTFYGVPSVGTTVQQQALSRFIGKASDARTAVLGGAFIKELHQTLEMIRHPAQALRKGVGDYLSTLAKRRRRLSPRRKPHVLSDTWLEYNFGWKPLIADIQAGKKALRNLPTCELKPISAFASEKVSQSTRTSSLSIGRYRQDYLVKIEGWRSYRYKGAVRVSLPSEGGYLQQSFGFDLSSFIPTVWEVIPYSFLVDYFTNIGDILTYHSGVSSNVSWTNQTARQGKSFVTVPLGGRREITPHTFGTLNFISWNPGTAAGERTSFSRTGTDGFPDVPEFRFQIPGAGSTRWLNIAALVGQARSLVKY